MPEIKQIPPGIAPESKPLNKGDVEIKLRECGYPETTFDNIFAFSMSKKNKWVSIEEVVNKESPDLIKMKYQLKYLGPSGEEDSFAWREIKEPNEETNEELEGIPKESSKKVSSISVLNKFLREING